MVKILILVLLCLTSGARAEAVSSEVSDGAIAFYEEHHTNVLVPVGDSLYFCTRAKAADHAEFRFRTLGFSFRTLSGGEELTAELALGESLRLLSQEAREEGGLTFLYALYELESADLLDRFRRAAQWEGKKAPAADSPVRLLGNAILILRIQEQDSGSIRENARGTVDTEGRVYRDPADILSAVNWHSGTDFSSYFNILVTLFLRDERADYRIRLVNPAEPQHFSRESLWLGPEGKRILEELAASVCPEQTIRISREEAAAIFRTLTDAETDHPEENRSFAKRYLEDGL